MALQHRFGGSLQLVRLLSKLGAGAAPGFGGIAGQFDPIDGEHLPADQVLLVAQVQHLGKDLADLIPQSADETGDGGEVRLGITGQGDESDLFPACPGDAAAADQPA